MTASTNSMTNDETDVSALGGNVLSSNNLRLLCVSPVEPSWISLTLQLDAEGSHEPHFRWASTATEALAILRDESFDCLIINDQAPSRLTV